MLEEENLYLTRNEIERNLNDVLNGKLRRKSSSVFNSNIKLSCLTTYLRETTVCLEIIQITPGG